MHVFGIMCYSGRVVFALLYTERGREGVQCAVLTHWFSRFCDFMARLKASWMEQNVCPFLRCPVATRDDLVISVHHSLIIRTSKLQTWTEWRKSHLIPDATRIKRNVKGILRHTVFSVAECKRQNSAYVAAYLLRFPGSWNCHFIPWFNMKHLPSLNQLTLFTCG